MSISRESFGSGIPIFDIFRGHYLDKEATWLEAVPGLDSARDRMRQIAAEKPGSYFVFSCSDRLVLDILNTGMKNEKKTEKKALDHPSAKHTTAGAA